jgi:Antibiotic biosynthesis monooxygenase
VTVGDPAAACWWHGGFGLRGVLTTVVGIRDRIRRLGAGQEAARQRATESDSSSASRSVSGSVTLWQADSSEDAARFIDAWTDDAAFMKQQSDFVSTQLHQGTAGSTIFVNVAIWESARALGRAFSPPEFQARVAHYPGSTVAAPHVFKKVAVSGICVA